MRKSKFKDGDRMDCKEIREMYKLMFAEYPDIVTVKDGKPKAAHHPALPGDSGGTGAD
jgi:hypothetical protein